jgi:hypothetical protein
MKITLKIFFIVLSLIMLGWLLKIIVVGAEVLGDSLGHIPFIYFLALFGWYVYEKKLEIQRLEYDIEYLHEVIKESNQKAI